MHYDACGFPRIHLPRTPLNKGIKKGQDVRSQPFYGFGACPLGLVDRFAALSERPSGRTRTSYSSGEMQDASGLTLTKSTVTSPLAFTL